MFMAYPNADRYVGTAFSTHGRDYTDQGEAISSSGQRDGVFRPNNGLLRSNSFWKLYPLLQVHAARRVLRLTRSLAAWDRFPTARNMRLTSPPLPFPSRSGSLPSVPRSGWTKPFRST